jgi:hypothetical protein
MDINANPLATYAPKRDPFKTGPLVVDGQAIAPEENAGIPWDTAAFREKVIDKAAQWVPLDRLPFVSTDKERLLLGLAYDWIVRIVGGTQGLSPDAIRSAFVTRVNAAVNLPLLPEPLEGMIFGLVYDLVFKTITALLAGYETRVVHLDRSADRAVPGNGAGADDDGPTAEPTDAA